MTETSQQALDPHALLTGEVWLRKDVLLSSVLNPLPATAAPTMV
jgi:hypothetical protein